MIIPIVGAIGMAVEGGGWYLVHRAAQNAADSASMAAALNDCTPGDACDTTAKSATYVEEAAAVAAKFGFTDDTSTDIATTKVNCPGTTSPDCYQVAITKRLPVTLVRFVGFDGDTTIDGQPAQSISASAIAMPPAASEAFPCMLGLATGTGNAITLSGMGSQPDGSGCTLRSNSGIKCNGANATNFPNQSYSANASNDCASGDDRITNAGTLDPLDPYSAASDAIPGSCPGATLAARYGTARTLDSTYTGGQKVLCGNTTLTSDVNVTTANSVLVIRGGYLNLGSHELKTSGSGSLTIIFSGERVQGGSTTLNHDLRFTSGGTVDKLTIRAPTSGPYSGIAMMQDKILNGNRNAVNMDLSGNQLELRLQGLIYMPVGSISVGGAINFFVGDLHCIAIAAWNITISGTGALANGAADDCVSAGLVVPPVPGAMTRPALVQ
jgi:hypothetical protein